MTDKTLNIYQRIHAIMQDLTYIQKGEKKVNNQYSYVSHDDVSKEVHKVAVKHRVDISVDVVESSIELVATKAGPQFLSKAKVDVTFLNIDDPQDFTCSKGMFGMGLDPQDKGPGKAISYACKFACLKRFLLETGDDPEHDQDKINNIIIEDPVELESIPFAYADYERDVLDTKDLEALDGVLEMWKHRVNAQSNKDEIWELAKQRKIALGGRVKS